MQKILIIDDEKDILESLSSILEDEGFSVLKAEDGKKGIAVYERENPDLVILDIWMPEMDGIEVLKRIKRVNKEAKVVVISGHGNISTAVEAVKKGAIDFLEKPLSLEKVLEVIGRCLSDSKETPLKETSFEMKSILTGERTFIQKTIGKSIVLYGHGLHTGVKTGMILLPMPENTGIIFEHVPDGERIPAFIDHVYSIGYASSLKGRNCIVRTIEHLMASCHMFGITNLLVKVSEEVPILDGSAAQICEKFQEAGIVEQSAHVEPIVVKEPFVLDNLPQRKYLSIEPSDELIVDFTIESRPPINYQNYVFKGGLDEFVKEIAPSRTYGFLSDFEMLSRMGFGEGGRINNVILLDGEKVINTKLRYEDEFVRHKILDLLGDLYLLNRPVIGKITARHTGHLENIALVKELKRIYGL
ncbi:MAG: UDP-3-O-acyl-N-acetylglucosamine deacetylase [Desulfobacterota bacterium]|nr:UDP-3-O-acyl-N-acetylglucosamine deacetylase [Thermodesulfobacteriota bacterium]MDW8002641.1 UDP-3-O-acyl-N-acetylglucosamine deacetylase [Deltaproteobacteria bacterium]